MDSCNFPRTIEEMLEAGWYNKLLKKVSKANLKDILNTPEELVQDIFTQIIRSNYLERYDPSYRPFDVYIYAVAENLIKKRGIRESTKGGRKIVNRAYIEASADGGFIEPNTVYLDTLEQEVENDSVSDSVNESLYMTDVISATKESLKEFKAKSSVKYHDKELPKDPSTVFELILAGKTVSEIATILHVSKQYVYVFIHKIRSVKAMQEFYKNMVENNFIAKSDRDALLEE